MYGYMGTGDLNSGPQAYVASAFAHLAILSALSYRLLMHVLCFKDQWNITDSHTKLAPDSKSKGELWDSRTIQGQEAKAGKKTNLFEDDDDEVDLFAIAKDR